MPLYRVLPEGLVIAFYIVFFMNKDCFCHVVLICLFFSYVWGQTLFSWWGILSCISNVVNAEFQLSATAGNFTSLITLNHIKLHFTYFLHAYISSFNQSLLLRF